MIIFKTRNWSRVHQHWYMNQETALPFPGSEAFGPLRGCVPISDPHSLRSLSRLHRFGYQGWFWRNRIIRINFSVVSEVGSQIWLRLSFLKILLAVWRSLIMHNVNCVQKLCEVNKIGVINSPPVGQTLNQLSQEFGPWISLNFRNCLFKNFGHFFKNK